MSSDPQTTLEHLVVNNYISLAGITVVVYDYSEWFTGNRSIEYIWLRPWTWVSMMFVVVCTMLWTICTVIYLISSWTLVVFLSATDLMMILRVYAMWNRSRTILSILLFIYVLQTVVAVVLDGVYNNPNTHVSVTLAQVSDFSFCHISHINTPATVQVYRAVPRLVLSAALVILAVSQTLKQSFEIYKATKKWQPNQYMQKLVGDGILYFIVYVLISPYLSCPSTFARSPDQILTTKMVP
ncbi:hypothetical protein EV363DRAFT_1173548 [Boletus edulis]|nr:hypothetical protein EV363DRAFT_1173548 [Boletus edulis]